MQSSANYLRSPYLFSGAVFFVILCMVANLESVSFEEDTRLTPAQGQVLSKFRERVGRRLPHKYMQENIFLVKWLRARNFDLDRAEEMLMKHLKWKRDNRIDQIDSENFRDMQYDFPWNLQGLDKQGRPLVQIVLQDWDIRQAAVTGKRDRLVRWVYKYFEDATKRVRQLQSEGKNVTQFTLILDADGFNPVNHGCPLCIPVYLTIANAYEEQFPGSVDKVHVCNTPEFFNVILRLIWPILSPPTRSSLKVHGTDKRQWRKVLSKDIDDSQLLPSFGGTLNNQV